MRGTEGETGPIGPQGRITPACAGNSTHIRRCDSQLRDHPRVCGEQHLPFSQSASPLGSPPRVRGTAIFSALGKTLKRITPACAGNRSSFTVKFSGQGDHPRVCGEQKSMSRLTCMLLGSPPRVRGTEGVLSWTNNGSRITPACAGNSRA